MPRPSRRSPSAASPSSRFSGPPLGPGDHQTEGFEVPGTGGDSPIPQGLLAYPAADSGYGHLPHRWMFGDRRLDLERRHVPP
jgi:hypothetical protein